MSKTGLIWLLIPILSPYHVLLLKKDGASEVFARVNTLQEQY